MSRDQPPESSEDNTPEQPSDNTWQCPNCGKFVNKTVRLCPNCGATQNEATVWPPRLSPAEPEPALDDNGDFGRGVGTGCVVVVASWVGYGMVASILAGTTVGSIPVRIAVGLVILAIQPTAYFLVKRRRKLFARGLGFTLLISWAIFLGLATACWGIITGGTL